MKPKAIYLIRHGESEGNIDEGIYKTIPDWQVKLTVIGKEQAEKAGRLLFKDININKKKGEEMFFSIRRPLIRFYVSPMARARETVTIINKYFEAEIREDPRLREQEWGNYAEDSLVRKIAKERKKFSTFYYRMPNGESGADVYDRQTMVIDTMHRDFTKDFFPLYACIVSHGLSIKAFLMRWFHWPAEDFDSYKTPKNCEILKMQLNDKGKYDLVTPLRRRKIIYQ